MDPAFRPLAVFVAAYAGFVIFPARRAAIALGTAGLLLVTGLAPWRATLAEAVPWPVLALLAGMMVLSDLFRQSRMPAVLAEGLVDRTRTVRGAFVAVCLVALAFSTVLDNVSVVLLLAPVVLSLAGKVGTSPVRPLVCVALCANLEGTATLIGDPPSMILANHLELSFNDFFFYRGRPGVFWAVQAGAVAALLVIRVLLRRERRPAAAIERESLRSAVPAALLVVLVAALALLAAVRPGFGWHPAGLVLLFAAAGVCWYAWAARWGRPATLLAAIDFRTLGFLLGMFVMVASLEHAGWLDRAAAAISELAGDSPLRAYLGIVTAAVAISAVVDNVPFLVAMLPVIDRVSADLCHVARHADALLAFGLLAGACLGGNITPIGASANVVAVDILRRNGHACTFRGFMRAGAPFTLASVAAGAAFIWLVWR
jgi:Na+/H+ antiporter NhaD/arsenite permease-like protein